MVPKMTVFLIFSTCSTARIHPWRHFFPEHPIIIYLVIPIMTLFYLSFQVLFFLLLVVRHISLFSRRIPLDCPVF